MSRPTPADPLVPFAVRIPTSLSEAIRAKAAEEGVTRADVLRSHLTLDQAKPLAQPRPRKRQPKELGDVSRDPPEVVRQMTRIGNNLNQLARATWEAKRAGERFDDVRIYEALLNVELAVKHWGATVGVAD
jgi:hypothetical protein